MDDAYFYGCAINLEKINKATRRGSLKKEQVITKLTLRPGPRY